MLPALPVALSLLSQAARAGDLHVGLAEAYPDLPSALAAASEGDRIVVHPGTYGPFTVGLTVEVVGALGPDVTIIEGAGATAVTVTGGAPILRGLTLDGQGSQRALEVTAASVTIEDSALSDGASSDDGGCGWFSAASVTLRRSAVTRCTAANDGGGLYAESDSHLTLDAVTLSSATAAAGRGGGVFVDHATLSIAGSALSDNLADDPSSVDVNGFGGGIFADDAFLVISGSRFERNEARSVRAVGGIGGALRSYSGDATIAWTVFDGNVASERGSAISARAVGTVSMEGSLFEDNRVNDPDPTPSYGGALFCEDRAVCVVEGDWFEDNTAGDGAAIGAKSPLDVHGSMFCSNDATDDGGAIDLGNLDPGIPISISGSVFSGNTAVTEGGAIVSRNVSVEISNNHFVDNTADQGSGVMMELDTGLEPSLELVNNLYADNTAIDVGGSAVHLHGTPLVEDYEWFYSNTQGDLDGTTGLHTVFGVNPQLAGTFATCDASQLVPAQGSPLVNAGSPELTDPDLTRSDIGAFGGPDAALQGFLDVDGDGWASMLDCEDADGTIRLDAVERCNGLDDDCDGLVDAADTSPDAAWLHPDADHDGLGDAVGVYACPGQGLVSDASDCDDSDGSVLTGSLNWLDADGDGYGDLAGPVVTCGEGPHASGNASDCDDSNPSVGGPTDWFLDVDGDQHGAGGPISSCEAPSPDWVAQGDDCNDGSVQAFPGAAEQCNGEDDDCNGLIDDDVVPIEWWPDEDLDTFGDPEAEPVLDCLAPGPDWASNAGDCNDGDSRIHPGATEVCGGLDEDCDGLLDQEDPTLDLSSLLTFFPDGDGDGYGQGEAVATGCEGPAGTAADNTDCDDGNGAIYPGAVEVPADSIDQDCDGLDAALPPAGDADGDGVYDEIDPDPLDAGGQQAKAPAPPYGCGCDGAGASAGSWGVLLALLGLRRRSSLP